MLTLSPQHIFCPIHYPDCGCSFTFPWTKLKESTIHCLRVRFSSSSPIFGLWTCSVLLCLTDLLACRSILSSIHTQFFAFFPSLPGVILSYYFHRWIVAVISLIVLWVTFLSLTHSLEVWSFSIPGLCKFSQRLHWGLCAVGSRLLMGCQLLWLIGCAFLL